MIGGQPIFIIWIIPYLSLIHILAAIAAAAKLLDMQNKGDYLEGDVFISTQICPHAPTAPHKPVPFMGSPVEMSQVNREEVSPELDAILSVDTTKGNRVINTRGCLLYTSSSILPCLPLAGFLLKDRPARHGYGTRHGLFFY